MSADKNTGDLYLQRILVKLQKPNGDIAERVFLGFSFCTPAQWKEISKKPLGKVLKSDDESPALMLQEPIPIEDVLRSNPNQHNIIDIIRDEAHQFIQEEENE